jgi:hypothetical protein
MKNLANKKIIYKQINKQTKMFFNALIFIKNESKKIEMIKFLKNQINTNAKLNLFKALR